MKKWICQVCGYVFEGENPPEKCPQCGVGPEKFSEQKGEMSWAAEHVVGVAAGVDAEILEGLRANFSGECTEVGMYLAMARVAHREGYPEIGLYWEKAAYEEAEHGATAGKMAIAKKAKELGLDAIHDTVHEMARDEARHGKAFKGLLERYFG